MRGSMRRGIGDMGNLGPQRDMGEELGREEGTTMITTTILIIPIPMHPGTKHVVRKLN